MKLLLSTLRICGLLVLGLLMNRQSVAQTVSPPIPSQLPPAITLTPGNNTATCSLSGAAVTISVPKEALTGDNIPLNIQVPGTFGANCQTRVTVTASSGLEFVTSEAVPVQAVGGNVFETVNPLPGNESRNFNVHFKFPPYVTCNGTVGTLTVKVEVNCNGTITECEQTVNVTGRAANYWTVHQEFLGGDLTCGISRWRVLVLHYNPNPTGLGTYRIDGTLFADPNLQIVSGATHTVNILTWNPGQAYNSYEVLVQNCTPEGSTITNNVDIDLRLGDGGNGSCETMQGTLTLTSPSMVSPNASISFTKQLSGDPSTYNLSPGCDGRYVIGIKNNGNVPWTNFVVTDVLPSGISLNNAIFGGAINTPVGWSWSQSGNTVTITGTNVVLDPNESAALYIAFTIDPAANPGDMITNTAQLSYQAAIGGGGGSSGGGNTTTSCPNIDCPVIVDTIQNTEASTTFEVEAPRAIPSIKKCIIDPPNAFNPPLYTVGNTIRFQIKVGNQGSGPLTATINDALGAAASQNLQIIPGSIAYTYYMGASTSVTSANQCNNYYGVAPEPTIPSGLVTASTSDLQNPSFVITNLPGQCEFTKMNVLVITFDALILPQMHGGKINKAVLTTPGQNDLQSPVAYTIDADGGLIVNKRADQEIVENGQTFNYIIDITNIGSVPLNNITLTDNLPDCVQRSGDILIKDALGNTITGYTLTGNMQLNLPPAAQIMPGETTTVTVPVQKVSGANCCNVTVYATGLMVNEGQALQESTFGSELEPAACVRSVECCDVPGFEAQLVQRDGHFYLQLTGGAVPLQEVDVTMLDFHVEYSSPDCKPANMGIFGQLSTTTTTLGGLVLGNGPMPAGNLSWGLGTASIVNGVLELEITEPGILDIPCCDFELTFCLKVRVKDVNCNVCEKTICYTAEPTEPPCDLANLEITSPGRICPGQPLTFTWSGGSPSGGVDIYLINSVNPTVYHVIATGVSNGTNSYSFTLPANFPCEGNQVWHIVIKDPKSDCQIISKRFTVTCCEPRCDCGEWLSRDIKITQVIAADNGNVQFESSRSILQKAANINVGLITRCGEKVRVNKGSYVLTAPNFGCTPESCTATYRWEIQRVGSNQVITGTGKSFPYQFAENGVYNIKIIPICGGKECEPCQIQVHVGRIIGTVNPDLPVDWGRRDSLR
ncbi:DUF11 domain-containing protein [Sphingobacterium sp. SGG-5]|uniref:Ser-Thr-rich GPI-anchored membrane family protein n=1 Tax=Sphingobacterium sp. SGG-5 TaxID=2710881 RepID=UPI0013EB623C|nr:Ser-Thr-rich GPI-anchored membrane family protein [Sphingobacterium sp. SGG-5]NGM62761.1 DUF11 domain-containing protein [Sphingobacterium sp. SGG-5]